MSQYALLIELAISTAYPTVTAVLASVVNFCSIVPLPKCNYNNSNAEKRKKGSDN